MSVDIPYSPESLPPPEDGGTAAPQHLQALRPVPWEDLEAEPSWWVRLKETVKQSFSRPMDLADRVPVTEGFWQPYLYLLLCSVPMLVLTAISQILSFTIQGALLGGLGAPRPDVFKQLGLGAIGIGALLAIVLLLFFVLIPIALFIGMILNGALSHLFLWMFGGTKEGVGLGQTIRCYGYAQGPYQLVSAIGSIPLVGCFFLFLVIPFLFIWLVYYGMALARMHRTESWRGICAAFAPIALSCCCVAAVFFAVFGFIASHAH